jgi:hypothetical protein
MLPRVMCCVMEVLRVLCFNVMPSTGGLLLAVQLCYDEL